MEWPCSDLRPVWLFFGLTLLALLEWKGASPIRTHLELMSLLDSWSGKEGPGAAAEAPYSSSGAARLLRAGMLDCGRELPGAREAELETGVVGINAKTSLKGSDS